MNPNPLGAPWHVSPTKLGQAMDIGGSDNSNVALVFGPQDGGAPTLEDLRKRADVISAAPDLLAILKEIVEADDRAADEMAAMGLDVSGPIIALTEKARSAVAKAEGRP